MEEITARARWAKPRKGAFGMAPVPAGWELYNVDTGNKLDSTRYATEDEAMAAAPGTIARIQARIAEHDRQMAERTAQPAEEPATSSRRYRTVHHSTFGTGRVYDDQPGATQYDDGTGRYSVQIWDNA